MQWGRRALGMAAALCAILLAGCAETTLAVHTAKQLGRDSGKPQGVYKVGEPYQISGVWYYPAEDYGYSETGIASYYGGESQGVNFHGRSTANGEVYDMNALTAAHQTLPMPSLVRVTNLENGRSVVLRVNDRGPFVRGRIIDVSRRSAQLLGFEGQGTARVRVETMAEESRALKTALLRGTPSTETTQVAAAPRAAVVSDALPPPPGARSSSAVASAALPPPSATLPPVETSSATNSARSKGKITQQPAARPAAPVIAQAAPPGPAPAAAARPRQTAPAAAAPTETAALPVTQQAAATAVVTQTSVQATSLFIQAGAFANYDNAHRMSVRLSRYGGTKVTPVGAGGQQLYRVRLGPINSVQEADLLLAEVTPVVPEARIVVD